MPTIALKTYNAAHKSTWRDLVIPHGVKEAVHGLSRKRFVDGLDAVYLHSRVSLTRSDFSYWICLDIEDTKTPGHIDLSANLDCARDMLAFLDDKGLTDNLSIFLTGQGLRFSWPYYVPLDYKRAFLAWIQKQSEIDSSPQTGNAFVRVLGYRGHNRQGKLLDQHIHKLDDIHDLWFICAEDYMDLTRGKPGYVQSMDWFDGILPTKAMPESWKLFLDGWKTFSELQQTIWKPDYSRQHLVDHEATWNQIYPYLDAMGIGYTEKTIADFWFLKLSSCPECGRKDGGPYITASGRLKCFHANSCRAGEMSESGRKGLPPGQWVDGFKTVELEQPERDVTFKTIEHARAELAAKIVQPHDMLFRCDPGTGKTYTALEQIVPLCASRKVLYLSPTNRLNGETCELAKTFSQKKVNIFRIEGRNNDNCQNYNIVMDAAEKGFSPGLMFCHYCQKDNPSPCAYQEQFKVFKEPAGLFITTHDQAKFIDTEDLGIDTMIVDEDPLQAFFEKQCSGLGAISRFCAGYPGDFFERLTKGLGKIYESCDGGDRENWSHNRAYTAAPPEATPWENSKALWDIAEITEEERDQLAGHLAAYDRWEEESQMKWQWRLYKEGVNIKALNWLWNALGEKDFGTAYVRVDLKSRENPYKFFLTRNAVPDFSGQIIVLDGTGNKPDTDALFRRDFELIDTCIDLRSCQKHIIKEGLGKTKCKKLNSIKKANLMKMAIQALRPTDRKILIATHQIIEDELRQIAVGLIPDRTVDSIHFYGNRGMNAFKDYDAIICFGAPGTNQTEMLDEAMALFADAAERKRWFHQKADAELLQTIHRIRPVNGNKNIILLSNRWLSELGPLQTETDRRRGTQKTEHTFSKAYGMLKAFYEIHGFVSLEIAYALGIGHCSKKSLLQMVQAKSSLCLIKEYILDKGNLQLPPSDSGLMLLQNKNSWSKLTGKLQSELQAPALKNRVHSQWQAAVGTVQAAKVFAENFGLKFNSENWRENHEAG